MGTWDQEVDVLVFGSGAAGMTAALVARLEGLEVLLCEKTERLGGTTATAGGGIWVPGNHQGKREGVPDLVENARRYMEIEIGAKGIDLREAFFAAGPDALDYLEENSEVKFKVTKLNPDYHPNRPGAALGGRNLMPQGFDGRRLGKNFELVRPPMPEFMVLGGMMVSRDHIPYFTRPWASLKALKLVASQVTRYLVDRLRYSRGTNLVLGNALVGRLTHSLFEKGAKIQVLSQLLELVQEEGRVTGAIVEVNGVRRRIGARRGVVLATGGFASNSDMRKKFMADYPAAHTLAFFGNTGDGIAAAFRAGAVLDEDQATGAFWMPASLLTRRDGSMAVYPHIRDRPKPGLIAVNAAGRRFVNEADSYHDFAMAMFRSHETVPTIPAYLICDRHFIWKYGIGMIHPTWQRLGRYIRDGYLTTADSLEELAAKINVDSAGLVASVREHNRFAGTGEDDAFGKGSTALNRFNGDAGNSPNPCLAAIDQAPYFAVKVYPAPISTCLGLKTDIDGRALDAQGQPIPGLYAGGNDMASVMHGIYPGPGITIGPGMTFAYRTAMHLAGKPVRATPDM